MPLRIEPINRSHNRRSFDCGSADLNQYLQNTARQQSEKGISRTFVIVDSDRPLEILGFFTLAACEIIVEKLPPRFAKLSKPSDLQASCQILQRIVRRRSHSRGVMSEIATWKWFQNLGPHHG